MKTTKDLYRIALLTVDWNYELVEKTFHGLKQYTEDHSDVQIFVTVSCAAFSAVSAAFSTVSAKTWATIRTKVSMRFSACRT